MGPLDTFVCDSYMTFHMMTKPAIMESGSVAGCLILHLQSLNS